MQQKEFGELRHIHHEKSFGIYLKVLRNRYGIKQSEVIAKLPAPWTQPMYSDIERGRTAPAFEDLKIIYQALQLAGVPLTLQERKQFLALAQEKLETKRTHRVQKSTEAWDELRRDLAQIDRLPIVDVFPHPHISVKRQAPTTNLIPARRAIAHLLGRETWLDSLIEAVKTNTSKVLIVQGPPGCGKTSEIHRLAHRFLQSIPRYSVVLSELPSLDLEHLDPGVALEVLLSDIGETIGPPYATISTTNLQARIRYTLECLAATDRPVVIFLDNVEQTLDEQRELTPIWRQFLMKFVQARHSATLIFATQEWPSSFLAETQLIVQTRVPPFSPVEGCELLQRLGLGNIQEEQLERLVEAVGGVPLCLEWVARLAQEPLLRDDWADFEEEADSEALLARLLEDPSLFSGPVARRVQPLLERVINRLSEDGRIALQELALSPVPLGAPALKTLYQNPKSLKELRDASLLVMYPKRVQLLPMVAALIRQHLPSAQVYTAEERLTDALLHWLAMSRTLDNREMGMIVTAIAKIYLKHQRLLDAAQFLIRHGWLSFHIGYTVHIARLALEGIGAVHQGKGERLDILRQSGAKLLYYFLAPYLNYAIDAGERLKDYHFIYEAAIDGTITLQLLTEIYLVRNLVAYSISQPREENFEKAQMLFSTCRERVSLLMSSDPDIQAALHEVHALLLTRWSDFAEEQEEREHASAYRVQAIQMYQEACNLLTHHNHLPSLSASLWKKRLAKLSTSLGYQLDLLERYEEALPILEQSILLKELGFVEPGSLASSYGEKSQALAELGRFEEALHYDRLAVEEIERLARSGDTLSQKERWIYLVNRACLFLYLQRIDEAEMLLRDAIPHIELTRRNFLRLAERKLKEIEEWREIAPSPRYQRDWRWIGRLRDAISYNAFWWLAHAGPFLPDEQQQWDSLITQPASNDNQKQLETIISQSRQRELANALAEKREPKLWYPAIPIEEVRSRLARLLQLDADIQRLETNKTIRELYHGKIEEETNFLNLIEAAYMQDQEHFWELNQQIHPVPTQEEMQYALNRVKDVVWQGLQREYTQEAAKDVLSLLSAQLHLFFDAQEGETSQNERISLAPLSGQPKQYISAHAAQRFFETVLREGACKGWQVILDANTSSARVEAASHLFILPERKMTVEECKSLLEHEVLNHIADVVAGEFSPLGLLAIGTRNYMPVSEGLALYHEIQSSRESGKAFDDSKLWLGTLSTGLASGICTPVQSFYKLYLFLKAFLILYRLLRRPDEDRETVQKSAHSLAQTLCLRTFRGVPSLQKPGVCYSKDTCYLRGIFLIERAVAEGETIIERLSIGRTALEYLPLLERLGVKPALQVIRKLAKGAELDEYISSFEETKDT